MATKQNKKKTQLTSICASTGGNNMLSKRNAICFTIIIVILNLKIKNLNK